MTDVCKPGENVFADLTGRLQRSRLAEPEQGTKHSQLR